MNSAGRQHRSTGRVALAALLAGAAIICTSGPASAVPPGNDAFASATALTTGVAVSANNTNATTQAGEKVPAKYFTDAYEDGPISACIHPGASIWYSIAPTVGRLHLVASSTFDATVKLWRAATPTPALTDLGGQQSIRPQTPGDTTLDADLYPGFYYWLSVDSCNASNHAQPLTGTDVGTVSFTPTLYARPANDNLNAAVPLTDIVDDQTVSILGASTETNEPEVRRGPDGGYLPAPIDVCPGAATVWYTIPTTGDFAFIVRSIDFDGVLKVWTSATNPASITNLTGIAAIRPQTGTKVLKISRGAGKTYLLSIDSCGNQARSAYKTTAAPEGIVTFAFDALSAVAFVTPTPNKAFAPGATLSASVNNVPGYHGHDYGIFSIDGTPSSVTIAYRNRGLEPEAQVSAAAVPAGTRALRYTFIDDAGLRFDVTEPIIANGPLLPGYAVPSGTAAAVHGKGVRTSRVGATHIGGRSVLASSTPGATITLRCIGRSVGLLFVAGRNGGRVRIAVGGHTLRVISLYAPGPRTVGQTLSNLAPGPHTVTMTVLGTHVGAATGNRVALASYRVYI